MLGERSAQLSAEVDQPKKKTLYVFFLRVRVRHDAAKCKRWRSIQMTAAVVTHEATGTAGIYLYKVDLPSHYIILG